MRALSDIDFDVAAGEVHCLAGENGSGKSTLIKIISGVQAPEPGGQHRDRGRALRRLTPVESSALGIQVIYQDLSLFPNLTVAENIAVGRHRSVLGLVNWRAMRATARPPWRGSAWRSTSTQRCRTCRSPSASSSPSAAPSRPTRKLVIMDEPTASLTRHEVDALLALTLELKRRDIA